MQGPDVALFQGGMVVYIAQELGRGPLKMDCMRGFARKKGIFLQVGGTQHDNIKKTKNKKGNMSLGIAKSISKDF